MRNMLNRTSFFPGPRYRRDQLPRNFSLPAIYRTAEDRQEVPAGEGVRDSAMALLEAAFFAADEPLPMRKLVRIGRLKDVGEVRQVLNKLRESYDRDGSAFQLEEIAGGFQLLTRPEYHRWLVRLRSTGQDLKLSGAARETLAIVAYRQPIMRAAVEEIRGVQCGETLRQLMEKGLVRIVGRDNSLGRPVLYGTTKKFLQYLGLKSLKEMPEIKDSSPSKRPNPPAATEDDPAIVPADSQIQEDAGESTASGE